MTARPSADHLHRPVEIAIVGNDLLLAALPGRPLQVAHAIHALGYDLVVPASWGEELVARHALDALESAGSLPMVFCACPKVRSRLLSTGQELLPHLIQSVAPPAATARFLRALEPDVDLRITYLGGCPGACDTSVDRQIIPADVLALLEAKGISVLRQPLVFESVIPPDRRRHFSLPGGAPTQEAVAERGFHFLLLQDNQSLVAELAEHLIAMERVFVDVAPALGCLCAGAVTGGSREAVVAIEPPRALLPILEGEVYLGLEPLPGPARQAAAVSADPSAPLVRDADTEPPPEVHSIEDAARRRAERRRIAVTPPGARNVTAANHHPQAAAAAEESSGDKEGREVSADQEPVGEARHTASPAVSGPLFLSAPFPQPDAAPPDPEEVSPMSRAPEPLIATQLAQPSKAASEPAAPAPAAVRGRQRTPVYGVWYSARATAHQRVVARHGTPVPRAYNAIRPRSGEVVTVAPPVEISDAPVHAEPQTATTDRIEVRSGPLPQPPLAPIILDPDADRGTRRRRRPSRRVDAGQDVPRTSRLWGLLMSILLIAALTVTLLLIFGA